MSRTAELQQRKTTSDDLGPDILHMCRKKYDVFLSYAEEDMEFAEEMRRRLIEHTKLRIFVPSDGRPTYLHYFYVGQLGLLN